MTTREEAAAKLTALRKSQMPIVSVLGEVAFESAQVGEGGTALVFPVSFGGAPAVSKFLVDLGSEGRRRRFRDEYQKLVRVRHPNVVALFHYEEVLVDDVSLPMIVMERCDGSLKKRFASLDSAKDRVALVSELVAQVLPALGALHSAGIVHRDLKPENLLFRKDGTLVVADFGIAKFDPTLHSDAGDATSTGERLGNRAYSAPEQENGGNITPAADLFAFGQLVHHALFGEPLRGLRSGRASEIDRSLHVWDEMLPRLLDMDAARRPQSVDELRGKLESLDRTRRRLREAEAGVKALHAFAEVVAEIAPGARGLVHVTDPREIDRAMGVVAREFEKLDLWWTRGEQGGIERDNNLRAAPRQLGEGLWLVDKIEMKIASMWVHQPGHGLSREFIALVNEPMPGFFGQPVESLPDHDEAGFHQSRYVTRHEYDDGYARLDGGVVRLDDVELRVRDHVMRGYLLVPRLSVLLNGRDLRRLGPKFAGAVLRDLELGKPVSDSRFAKIDTLPRHEDLVMID